jgi:hypothetical protein
MTHTHHKIARSRGGTDDEWNLVEMDPYTHAYEHALDYVLFDHAPQFDFRHEAWPLLPDDLKKAVLDRKTEGCSEFFTGKLRPPEIREKIKQSKLGILNSDEAKSKMREAKKGTKNHNFGKPRCEIFGQGSDTSKKVKVSRPDGTEEIFASTKSAGKHLGCPPSNVAKWASKNHTPRVGKFSRFTFQYVQPK